MKVIVAGSRSITRLTLVSKAIADSDFEVTEIVSGCARGVDRLGEQWANYNDIPIHYFPADWDQYGKSAGYRRNEEMAEYADALVAVYDGFSLGTQHMIQLANTHHLKVYVQTKPFDKRME